MRQCGHSNLGIPFAIVAILAGLALEHYWDELAGSLQVGGLIAIGALVALSAWSLLQPAWPASTYDDEPGD